MGEAGSSVEDDAPSAPARKRAAATKVATPRKRGGRGHYRKRSDRDLAQERCVKSSCSRQIARPQGPEKSA